MKHLRNNLKSLRKSKGEHGKTQEEVALDLGFKKTTYAGYETGHSKPGLEEILKLSEYFGVTIDDLLNKDIDFGNKLRSVSADIKKAPGSKYKKVEIPLSVHEDAPPYGNYSASDLVMMLAGAIKSIESDIKMLKAKK